MLKLVVVGDINDNFTPTMLTMKFVKKYIKKLTKDRDVVVSKSLRPFVKDYLKEHIVYAPDGMYNGDCITDLNNLYQDTVLILEPKDQMDLDLKGVEVCEVNILQYLGDEPTQLFDRICDEYDVEDFTSSDLKVTKEMVEVPCITNTFRIINKED